MKPTKIIRIARRPTDSSSYGDFGFTLRHFIDAQQQQQQQQGDEALGLERTGTSLSPTFLFTDLFVQDVRQSSPAASAGLRPGDRIVQINDQSVQGQSYSQLIALIEKTRTDLILHVESTMSSNLSVEQQLRNVHLIYSSPYHNDYIPYDYPDDDDDGDYSWTSPSTELIEFRKKQFETGQMENPVRLPHREWNRLTTGVESVMERAAHFEQIDPEKFPRFKSKSNDDSDSTESFGRPPSATTLLRHDSYISAIHPNQHRQFSEENHFHPQTPLLRRKADPELKQRRASYLLATDQRVTTFHPDHQTQAIKKLKNFFGEGSPQVAHALDPFEASKEGILYCKTVMKDGRRALDRSWRGAWAVLRRGALFLGKEKKHGLLIPLSCDSFPIHLRDAQVELARDYMKKPRVFKLVTSNQSEFFFQAVDVQSLNEWLDLLRQHCQSAKRSPSSHESPCSTSTVVVSPARRSFVKSIVKKGLRTLKSSSSLLSSQTMSGQIYDETGESLLQLETTTRRNFSIELEECQSSSFSRFIPIVVEILTCLVERRGITSQGIYRHAGGLTTVNWLVNQLDKGTERIELNSERWYDVKAVASTLKTFFAKLPDSLLSSKMSSLCVEASRIESHRQRLIELKRLVVQLDNHRFETLKYLCAHFRRVTSKCHLNKIDARNLAIIFGPTLIWDSKASLQLNLVDNPEKIRIIESFILYYEWFFDSNDFERIPSEIHPQMPQLAMPVNTPIDQDSSSSTSAETKPAEIIEEIVRAAKRRWSSTPLHLDSLSSLKNNEQQQTSKPIQIVVRRNAREEIGSSRSRSVDSSLHSNSTPLVSSSTGSTSSRSSTMKKKLPSQSLRDISHLFHSLTLSSSSSSNTQPKSSTYIRRKKLRKKIQHETFLSPDEPADSRGVEQRHFFEQTSKLKSQLIEHESILQQLKEQLNQVDQQLTLVNHSSSADGQLIHRRHTFNSLIDRTLCLDETQPSIPSLFSSSSSSSLFALQLL